MCITVDHVLSSVLCKSNVFFVRPIFLKFVRKCVFKLKYTYSNCPTLSVTIDAILVVHY